MTSAKVFTKLFIAPIIFCLVQCVTSPTGRHQLSLISQEEMENMGTQAFTQMKEKGKVSNDPDIISYVKCVANPLLQQIPSLPNIRTKYRPDQWEIQVFIDESANAFALPGAKIGVHTGILQVAKTDAQLAAVLGHEIAHVLANHGNERVSQALAAQSGLQILSGVLEDNPNRNTIMGLLGVGAQYGVLLPYSRHQETEADIIGQDLMASAGFNPEQSVELWKNMTAESKGAPPELMSTHPAGATRIERLGARLQHTKPIYASALAQGRNPVCKLP